MEKEIIVSDCDNTSLDVSYITPIGDPKGIVFISHGMAEHKERYFDFLIFLANNGYVAVIHDHRGHGKSLVNNELGFLGDNKADFIVEDLAQIIKIFKSRYPNKKFILFGHSMGSMVARKYIKKYDKEIDKLILCGSPSNNPLVDIGLGLAKAIKYVKGENYRSPLLQKMTFGKYNNKFKNSTSPNAWICSNTQTVEDYDSDKLCGFTFTVNGFENLFNLVKSIYNKDDWALNNLTLPILFIAGSDDPVIINKDKWKQSQDFLRSLGYNNIKSKLYDGLRHELLNETNKETIYKDIIDFINN